jgi:hypothetical protein
MKKGIACLLNDSRKRRLRHGARGTAPAARGARAGERAGARGRERNAAAARGALPRAPHAQDLRDKGAVVVEALGRAHQPGEELDDRRDAVDGRRELTLAERLERAGVGRKLERADGDDELIGERLVEEVDRLGREQRLRRGVALACDAARSGRMDGGMRRG